MCYLNQRKNARGMLGLFFSLILLTICTLPVKADIKIPNPTNDFFVNDFADVLSNKAKGHINQTSRQYQDDGGPQVVVATIESLEGSSIEEYSLNMAREWGIGSKEDNNGVLILLAVKDRTVRVEVGYGLEGVITDSLSGRFIREVTPELSDGNYSDGIEKLYDLVVQELEEPGDYEANQDDDSMNMIWVIIVIIFLFLGGFFGPRGRRRFGGYYGRGPFYGGPPGGGFSGGSGGLGGGGFSGGGGGFGGGGASGKFLKEGI